MIKNENEFKTTVFPNPNLGVFTLVGLSEVDLNEVKFVDMTGKEHAFKSIRKSNDEVEIYMNEDTENGLYFVSFSNENGSYTLPILIHN